MGKKEIVEENYKKLYFIPLIDLFFLVFEQVALNFHFALGPTNYEVGTDVTV